MSEQNPVFSHFNDRADYWKDIYSQETFPGYALRKRRECVLELCRKTAPGGSLLDIGCGAGSFTHALAKEGYAATGIDLAPQMVESAKKEAQSRNLQCSFKVASADQIPFADQTFDAALAVGVFEYIPSHDKSFYEIHRILKPEGKLIVTMPNGLDLYRLIAFPRSLPMILGPQFKLKFRQWENQVRKITGLSQKDESNMWLGQAVTIRGFKRKLEKFGFRPVGVHGSVYGPLHPLGFKLKDDKAEIEMSENLNKKFGASPLFQTFSSYLIFHAEAVK
jgi:ubiquinone/menaquinone biosynthesis C-methylase UbiE